MENPKRPTREDEVRFNQSRFIFRIFSSAMVLVVAFSSEQKGDYQGLIPGFVAVGLVGAIDMLVENFKYNNFVKPNSKSGRK